MRAAATLALLAALALAGPVAAADYDGPLIDAHSHLPDATAIDAYVAAMGWSACSRRASSSRPCSTAS